ncbi:MAG: bifunctional molybdenum cofactor biosynthesis protein MoaC/MoaB [Vicingaceae bacterium]
MIDITHKTNTLREAAASVLLKVSSKKTIEAIKKNEVPKGNVLEAARTAGLLGVKLTPNIIPDCHVIPIESAVVEFQLDERQIKITMRIKTIYKTGVEVEAMHGASVVALTMYDMLKPIDKGIEITDLKLESKTGGKSDYVDRFKDKITAIVIVCSDTVASGQKEDRAGKTILSKLALHDVNDTEYTVIPDESKEIIRVLQDATERGIDLIIFTGGTGLSKRDVTPESIEKLLDRRIPGIEESIRRYGQERMPYAMLSRSLAGIKNKSLVLSLPGSTKGAAESMDAVFPHVLHVFGILSGKRHEK